MPNVNLHLQTLPSDIKQCFQKQDQHCKKMYYVIGFFLFIFLIWLIALSASKSRAGKEGERGPPGPAGPSGQSGSPGATKNEEMKNTKIFYITKNEDFGSSTKVKKRSGFILGNGVNSDATITLPHFSVIGNGATFYLFNQSPVFTFIVKAAKINGQKPAQMSFNTGGTKLKLLPNQFALVVIMAQQYVVFSDYAKKPVLHWVNSWNNCGGIPNTDVITLNSTKGFAIGPSLITWGCDNYKKDMDVVRVMTKVKNGNTTGKNPKDVSSGGIYVVFDPDGVQLPGTISQNILIGTSSTNTKTITLPAQAVRVSSKPVNKQNKNWGDKFKATLTSNGTKLKVNRTDTNGGWAQELILKVDFISSVA